jgi:hypothetical protein
MFIINELIYNISTASHLSHFFNLLDIDHELYMVPLYIISTQSMFQTQTIGQLLSLSLSHTRDPCLSIYLDKIMESSCYCECRFLNSIFSEKRKRMQILEYYAKDPKDHVILLKLSAFFKHLILKPIYLSLYA